MLHTISNDSGWQKQSWNLLYYFHILCYCAMYKNNTGNSCPDRGCCACQSVISAIGASQCGQQLAAPSQPRLIPLALQDGLPSHWITITLIPIYVANQSLSKCLTWNSPCYAQILHFDSSVTCGNNAGTSTVVVMLTCSGIFCIISTAESGTNSENVVL